MFLHLRLIFSYSPFLSSVLICILLCLFIPICVLSYSTKNSLPRVSYLPPQVTETLPRISHFGYITLVRNVQGKRLLETFIFKLHFHPFVCVFVCPYIVCTLFVMLLMQPLLVYSFVSSITSQADFVCYFNLFCCWYFLHFSTD